MHPILVHENEPRLDLFNGDVGVLFRDGAAVRAVFRSRERRTSRVVAVAAAAARARVRHERAQEPGLGVRRGRRRPAAPGSPLLSRELLYTAVTRARRRVVVHGRSWPFAKPSDDPRGAARACRTRCAAVENGRHCRRAATQCHRRPRKPLGPAVSRPASGASPRRRQGERSRSEPRGARPPVTRASPRRRRGSGREASRGGQGPPDPIAARRLLRCGPMHSLSRHLFWGVCSSSPPRRGVAAPATPRPRTAPDAGNTQTPPDHTCDSGVTAASAPDRFRRRRHEAHLRGRRGGSRNPR